ncbi:hypothetical protein O181_104188 [Austropuccinia psidii MF-1]|uniref:Uncharacterized protein n=1 Tax=Austropuccinia psidii MF-1 TaxID=1389203 RepID=A0A9Q3JJN7_9BASI|nr:hypothetical protein [Austropuccinia psidii MF-1]
MPTLMLELASASLPNPLQCLAFLCAHTPLQMRPRHFPPNSALTTPYASTHPCLPSLHSCSALKMRLQFRSHHSLCFRTPTSYSPWLTIVMLMWGPQVMPLTPPLPPLMPPRTCGSPSLHLWMPTQNASEAAYHPYACVVPSRNASNTPLTLALSSTLLMILMLLQCPQDETRIPPPFLPSPPLTLPYPRRFQFLCSCGALKICLQHHLQPTLRLNLSLPLTILTLRY